MVGTRLALLIHQSLPQVRSLHLASGMLGDGMRLPRYPSVLLTCMNLTDKLSGEILLLCNLRGSSAGHHLGVGYKAELVIVVQSLDTVVWWWEGSYESGG